MRRYWRPLFVFVFILIGLLVIGGSASRGQEKDLRYSYRFGCPSPSNYDYCPTRYQSLSTGKRIYHQGEEVKLILANLQDFEYLVEKVEVYFEPQFEHDYELFYVEREVGPISRNKDSWTWTWDQRNEKGQQVGIGSLYIRITLNCCKNYRTYFKITRGSGEVETPTPPEEEEVQVPGSPAGLSLQALSSTEIELTWNDNSENESGFRVYRNGELIEELNSNTTSYVDTGLTGGKDYTYRVSSFNEAGESGTTASLSTTTPVEVSSAPRNLSGTVRSPTEIRLTWNDTSGNESGFRIYRNGKRITEVGPNTTSYVDTGLNENTSYTYRVASYNEAGESSMSSGLELETPLEIPSSPGSLRTETLSPSSIKLTWNDNSNNEQGFRIYRNGSRIATVGANITTYTDTGVEEGRSYSYRVASFNESGESSLSGSRSLTTPLRVPGAPDSLSAKSLSPTRIRLLWNDNSNNEDGFRIYRNGTEIATVGANVTSYTDTGLKGNANYTYRVSAYNDGQESSLSSSLSTTTPVEVSSAPRNLSGTVRSPTEIRLTWNDTSGNESGFRIYRNGKRITEVGPNTTSYVDTGLNENTSYTYRVASYNEAGESSMSSGLELETPLEIPSSPGSLRTETLSPSSIKLTWNDNSNNEQGFRIYRNGSRIATVGANSSAYIHEGLNSETRYCYEVVAYNSSGESGSTNRNCSMTGQAQPNFPRNLNLTPLSSSEIRLRWNDNSDNEDGFRIYRNGTEVATVGPNKTMYTDTGLVGNRSYTYSVSAFNDSGESKLASSGAVRTPPAEKVEKPKPAEPRTEPLISETDLLAGIGVVVMVLGYIYSEMG